MKNYGFEYEHEGSSFVFHIVAKSEEDAKAQALSMRQAAFVGELKVERDSAVELVQRDFGESFDVMVGGAHIGRLAGADVATAAQGLSR